MNQVIAEGLEAAIARCPMSGCWLWTGAMFPNGYGMARGPEQRAHRAAWIAWRGPIPIGMCVLHSCDVRCCVNPNHLFIGTRGDNNTDRSRKGRSSKGSGHWHYKTPDRTPRGEAHGMAKLSEVVVRAIRASVGTHREIAAAHGCARTLVTAIKNGKIWRHVQ